MQHEHLCQTDCCSSRWHPFIDNETWVINSGFNSNAIVYIKTNFLFLFSINLNSVNLIRRAVIFFLQK